MLKLNNKILKLPLTLILLLGISICLSFYFIFSYKILLSNFTDSFSQNKFSNANTILITKGNFNPIKKILIKDDLSNYFNNIISEVPSKLDNNEITKNQVINLITEINRYDFIDTNANSLLSSLNYEDSFSYGVSLYSSGKYVEAYNVFITINSTSTNYTDSLNYTKNCVDQIKTETLKQASDLCTENYYTKALNLINDVTEIIGNDKEVIDTIADINKEKEDYIAKRDEESVTTSNSVINYLNTTNINKLSIESLTKYLIHVDLTNQKTYVYTGKKDAWSIIKTFTCSTGITGEETPEGIYTVQEKGDWFYSKEYKQGGKYWIQFSGNYLFHSLPYNEDKSKIVDFTLGKPSSHGCIRLAEADSKWIYDSVPEGSKVIIK